MAQLTVTLVLTVSTTVRAFPSFTSWEVTPQTTPHAGEQFYVEVSGSNVDVVNNRVAIMDFSDGASTCAGASLVADSSVESLTKVKETAPCNGTYENEYTSAAL